MSPSDQQALADRYDQAFGNLDDITHPAIMTAPRFLALLESALKSGKALDRAAVEAEFGEVAWDW